MDLSYLLLHVPLFVVTGVTLRGWENKEYINCIRVVGEQRRFDLLSFHAQSKENVLPESPKLKNKVLIAIECTGNINIF
jgi:hypothetical protein